MCNARPKGAVLTRVAVFSRYYLPSVAGGGGLVSLLRLIAEEDQSTEFLVLTSARNLPIEPRESASPPIHWQLHEQVRVGYMRNIPAAWLSARKELKLWDPDFIFFNSLHSPHFTILPLLLTRLRILRTGNVILAPRGECGSAALNHRAIKKRLAAPILRTLTHDRTLWYASTADELRDIETWRRQAIPAGSFIIRQDSPAPPSTPPPRHESLATKKVTFASRIDQMKGLDIAIELLRRLKRPIHFEIYGVISDYPYWEHCKTLMMSLPSHVSYEYRGPYQQPQSSEIFAATSALLLPTRGENFGHVIAEALSVGCPVVTSTNTIWTELLNTGAGSAADLERNLDFMRSLLDMSDKEEALLRESVHAKYARWFSQHHAQTRPLFEGFK